MHKLALYREWPLFSSIWKCHLSKAKNSTLTLFTCGTHSESVVQSKTCAALWTWVAYRESSCRHAINSTVSQSLPQQMLFALDWSEQSTKAQSRVGREHSPSLCSWLLRLCYCWFYPDLLSAFFFHVCGKGGGRASLNNFVSDSYTSSNFAYSVLVWN